MAIDTGSRNPRKRRIGPTGPVRVNPKPRTPLQRASRVATVTGRPVKSASVAQERRVTHRAKAQRHAYHAALRNLGAVEAKTSRIHASTQGAYLSKPSAEDRQKAQQRASMAREIVKHPGRAGAIVNQAADLGLTKLRSPNSPLIDAIGNLIPDSPTEQALLAAGGAGSLLRAGKEAKDVGEAVSAATKVESAATKTSKLRRIKTAVKERPRPVQAAKKTVAESKPVKAVSAKAERVAAKTPKPVKAVGKVAKTASRPVRYPMRKAGEHPLASTVAAVEGPGAVAAATGKKDFGKRLTAPIEGTAKALLHPEKTGSTTLHTLPGLVTVPVGIGANAALSAYRAGATAAQLKHYSGAEITAPVKSSAKAIEDFAKEYVDVYGSGDAKKIQKATEEEFGVGQLLPLLGAARSRAVRRGDILENPERGLAKTVTVRGKKRQVVPVVGKKLVTRRVRKGESREHARAEREAHFMGEAPGKRTDKALGETGRHKRVKQDETRAMATAMAKEGATTPEHIREAQAARNGGKKHGSAKTGTVTYHDLNPEDVNHPQVQKAADIMREEQPAVQYDENGHPISERKQYESVMVTDPKNTLPQDRILPKGTAVTFKVDKRGNPVRADKPGRTVTRPLTKDAGFFKNPKNTQQDAVNAALDKVSIDRAKQFVEETGRTTPTFISSVPAHKIPVSRTGEAVIPKRDRGRSSNRLDHFSEGKLNKAGLEDLGYEATKVHSFYGPRVKRVLNTATARGVEGQAKEFPVLRNDGTPRRGGAATSKVLTDDQKDAVIDQIKRAGGDPGKILWLDMQTTRAAVMDQHGGIVEIPIGEGSVRDALHRLAEERKVGLAKGPAWIGVDRTWGEEFLRQHGEMDSTFYQKIGQGLLPTQRVASKALLGYSPSWLLAQPIAEGAQALAAVGPYQMYKGHKVYQQMSEVEKRQFDALVGATAGTGSIMKGLTEMRARQSGKGAFSTAFEKNRQELLQSRPGRVLEGVATGRYANSIDRSKGLAIRRLVAAGHLSREYEGFTGALNKLLHEQSDLDRQMRDMTPVERMRFVTRNPKAAARLEGYLDDVMGNWTALTTNERALSGAVIFYPFVRMSAEWAVLTYPARHPLKAAAMQFLAQENAQQVENLLGGKPSFFTQWADVPLYAGRGKQLGEPTGILPLQRIAPGSNAIVEALGGDSGPRDYLRATNPFLNAAVAAFGGYDPTSGRSQIAQFEKVTPRQFVGSIVSSIGTMPSALRIADAANARKITYALKGKPVTPTAEIFQILGGNQILRSLVPFIPNKTSKERQKAEISRLLERKYAADQLDFFKDIRPAVIEATKGGKDPRGSKAEAMIVTYLDGLVASNQLNKLYERYGIQAPKPLTGRAKELAGATSDMTLPQSWNDILKGALGWGTNDVPTGLKLNRLKKLRRAKARSLMGNS